MSVGFGTQQPEIASSSDQMMISRHAQTLTVTVNGDEFKKRLGSARLATDIYLVANENPHGLGAIRGEKADAVVHTLVIDESGANAIWTESGVSWVSPFQLFNSTITFHCSNERL